MTSSRVIKNGTVTITISNLKTPDKLIFNVTIGNFSLQTN